MGVNSILVIFKGMGLDEIPQGENIERNEQQAPIGVLSVSNNIGIGRAGSETYISPSLGERRGQHGRQKSRGESVSIMVQATMLKAAERSS